MVESGGAALTSLALVMLAVGVVLVAPTAGFADDGSVTAPVATGCDPSLCSYKTRCQANKPGACAATPSGPVCEGALCFCTCKTILGANYPVDPTDKYCDCGDV